MRDYVVQSGPLRTFDVLYDNRFDKLRPVGDYHTISITGKPTTQRIHINKMSRSSDRELKFVSTLFSALAHDNHAIFGIRDIIGGKAGKLSAQLFKGEGVQWHKMTYGNTDDDLILVELKNFAKDFQMLEEFAPPDEGTMFFYLTAAPFDIYKLYWERACNGALKIKDDRFRRDVMILAPEAKISLWMEPDGSYTILLHPRMKDVEAVEREITAAGEKAGMTITFAPGLFG